ncbi:MAG: hypothetical protein JWO09_3094 [Bacteroidetes bacterium]|nr:hypothetical protein [Bacteroidota bacterium]
MIGGMLALASCKRSADLSSFSWLAGKWVGKYDTVPIFEQWKPAEGNVMYGRGGVLAGKDTAFAEEISIEEREDGLYYVAVVKGNPAPAAFKFTGFKNDTAVFEDPKHDFPQRVLYYKNGDGTFYACIDGRFKGKYVKEEFSYKKAQEW